ncbi:hypothetical protein Q765_00185 [Flavobacterium rivuli WB 3.3-2 = DSM 21788]|uniref:Uncharacterized protein n=1 Tax=Flavobacterium rivuli WB 3.3-2 = DSM 21788 TaxID=1121895 RepID=A0A0A2M7W8_9FLAO|nr:hypothetical protein [Flavobacterium rivuli]KGO88374.1 hypothetical protein Q765_00185 [Flavobacterium rivuli WB 3.3-2 = DSM 21788]
MGKDTGIQLIDHNDDGEILDVKIEVERDASGKIIQGIVVGNTLQQNKALILITHQGEVNSKPDIGVGFEDSLMSNEYLEYRHKIREHYAKDGLNVSRLDLYENKPIVIDADYNR